MTHTTGVELPRLGLTDAELAERRTGLGGTDASAVLGLNRWRSALDVYAEKVEGATDDDFTERMMWGLLAEPMLHKEYQRRTGMRLTRPRKLLRHPRLRWMLGHPDALGRDPVTRNRVVVDYKLSQWGDDFGEPGSDEVPAEYRAQLWHYMVLTGCLQGRLFVLVGGAEAREYIVPWSPRIEDFAEELGAWWDQHVVAGVPPEPDGSEASGRAMRRRWAPDAGEQLVAMPHQYGLLRDFLIARHKKGIWGDQEERLKQNIQAAMATATELHAPGFKASWKLTKPKPATNWAAYAFGLEGLLHSEEDRATAATLKGLHTFTPPGVRTFRATVDKDTPLMIATEEDR